MLFAYLASPWIDVDSKRSVHGDSVRALDGIRGLAVIIVILAHCDALGMSGQGGLGVFLFFTLSGFVLMLPFADHPERIFRPREIAGYFINRALRILPNYVVAVVLIAWQFGASAEWTLLNLSFVAGWNHLWSVAEEVRFYVLFPFVLAVLALVPGRWLRIAALAGLIWLAWALRNLHMISMMDGLIVPFYFYFFLTGAAASLIYIALPASWHRFGGLATILIMAAMLSGHSAVWQYQPLWCAIFFMLLVAAARYGDSAAGWFLRSWPMRHLGLLSYSLYLYHVSVMLIVKPLGLANFELFVVVFGGTYVVALAAYLLVEKPFLMLKPAYATRDELAPTKVG